jgi:hypothetical protein
MKKIIFSTAIVLSMILAGLNVKADSLAVIYSNFGTNMGFDTNTAHSYFVTGSSFPSTCPTSAPCITSESLAVQFTPSANYTFNKAQLAVFLESGTNTLDVYIETDSSGFPGSIISAFQVNGQMTSSPGIIGVGDSLPGVSLLQGPADPTLMQGTAYWLVAYAPSADTQAAWSWNSTKDSPTGVVTCQTLTLTGCTFSPSNLAVNSNPNPAATMDWAWVPGTLQVPSENINTSLNLFRPVFEIDGSPTSVTPPSAVPEPASSLLFCTGFLGLCLILRQRHFVVD